MSLRRNGPPARRTPLRSRGPLRRSPSRGRPASTRTKIPTTVRRAVERRAAGQCEIRANGKCEKRGYHCHHKLMRSAGGRHEEDNLVLTCEPCHQYVHAHPNWSYENGWLIRRAAV